MSPAEALAAWEAKLTHEEAARYRRDELLDTFVAGIAVGRQLERDGKPLEPWEAR